MRAEWNINDLCSELKPYWNLCVGSCHAATALRQDYREQLTRCHKELGFRYVRFHGLLDDDMSVLKKNLKDGKEEWVVSFTNIDSVFDFLLSIGMKPFVEISFMPECLKSKDATFFHYKAYSCPPSDYERWDWLIRTFVEHMIERYGRGEVRQWYFEVWNEPDIGGREAESGFWLGSREDYFELYHHTALAIKQIDRQLRVGGPATSYNKWIREFLAYCQETATPVDFVTTHHYPVDVVLGPRLFWSQQEKKREAARAQGLEYIEDEEQVDIWDDAVTVEEQQNVDIPLWNYIERGILTEMTRKVRSQAKGLPVIYTEWNSLSGLPSDGPFGSSFILKTIMDNAGLIEGYSYWTFSDIFEEGGMPSKEFHGGYGLMTLHGVPKASYRAFQMLEKLGRQRYVKIFSESTMDVYAFRKEECQAVQVLAVNHNSLCHEIREEELEVKFTGMDICEADVELLDETHGNSYECWKQMGEPEYVSREQLLQLEAASCTRTERICVNDGSVKIKIPPMGAALLTFYSI